MDRSIGPEASKATLRVLDQKGPAAWTWRFNDAHGSVSGKVTLDPTSPADQILLDHHDLARRTMPAQLREQITQQMVRRLGVIGERLAASSASMLHVSALRAGHVALSLPFEFLFRPGGAPGAVIRCIGRTRRMEPYGQPFEGDERIAAAFVLRAEDPYLPLHAEAASLAMIASRAGTTYDEHFIMFSAEDLLAMTRNASVVHIAGHGRNGALACDWRSADVGQLTSMDLIDAWRDRPPRLVVLNFCESSSGADARRLIELGSAGGALEDYARNLLSPVPHAPSPSMALDLVAALPTTVLALRTVADDSRARTFGTAFYSHHFSDRLPVEQAYAATLAEHDFSDEVGLPIPTLYASEAALPQLGTEPGPTPDVAEQRCLQPQERRLINLFQPATAPLGNHLDGNWVCFFSASTDPKLKRPAETAVASAVRLWETLSGKSHDSDLDRRWSFDQLSAISCRRNPSDERLFAVDIPVECVGNGVCLGELLAQPRNLGFADLALIGRAACDVPMLIDASLECDLAELAEQLAEISRGRSPIVDRQAPWDLAQGLLEMLPAEQAQDIKRWSDAKWRALADLGPDAVDIVASHFLHGNYARRFEDMMDALNHLAFKRGLPGKELYSQLDALISAGVVLVAASDIAADIPGLLFIDLLTACRAWSQCSTVAAEALIEHLVDREFQAMPDNDFLVGMSTARLAAIGELCLAARDSRIGLVLDALGQHDDSVSLAKDLRARADSDLLRAADQDGRKRLADPWRGWEEEFQAGRPQQAMLLLEREEVGEGDAALEHPLRLAVRRLLLVDEERVEELSREADRIEGQLVALLRGSRENDAELGLLLAVRQIKARVALTRDNPAEAQRILVENFQETREYGQHPSTWVFAGASAASLLSGPSPTRARVIWDGIEQDARALPVSAAKVFALSTELMILAAEKRRVQARVAARALLEELGTWREPRPDMARISVEWCAQALLGEPVGFALICLRKIVEGTFSAELNLDLDPALMARVFGELPLDQGLAEAESLAERIPAALEALGVTAADLAQRVREDYEDLARAPAVSVGELALGETGRMILRRRATAGCPLADVILRSAAESTEEEPPPAAADGFHPLSAADFRRLAAEHGSLREAAGALLSERFDDIAPLLAASSSGDLEARAQCLGVMISDLESEEDIVEAQFAVVRGEGQQAQRILEGGGDVSPVAGVAAAIEVSMTGRGHVAAPDSALASLAADSWRLLLDNSPDRSSIAAAALRGLASLLAPLESLLLALSAGGKDGEPLEQHLALENSGPLVNEILARIEDQPDVQVALAEQGLVRGAADAALELLTSVDGRVEGRLLARVRRARLKGEIDRRDRKGCSIAIDRLEQAIGKTELSSAELGDALGLLAMGGLVSGRYDVARAASRGLIEGPGRLTDPAARAGAHLNGFQAAMQGEGPEGGAAALLAAGNDLGFSTACWIVQRSSLVQLDETVAGPLVEALLELVDETEDPFFESMRPIVENVLRSVEASERWPVLRKQIEKRLGDR